MRTSTFLMLALAIVFGSVAVFLANIWLNQQSLRVGQEPAPAPAIETSTIVVAAKDFTFGMPLQAETLREMPWPKNSVPEGAYSKISDVLSEGRRVALTSISVNEPILKWKIDPKATIGGILSPGMRAVSVRVNDVLGVAGFVLPGDRVDVLYTRLRNNEQGTTDILIQNVRVLAVDQMADEKKDEPLVAKVATIEVTPNDAQKVQLAQQTGSLGLSLRGPGEMGAAPRQRVVEAELVSSQSIFMDEFNARKAADEATNRRLAGIEEKVQQTAKSFEQTLGEFAGRLAASESSKDALASKLKEDFAATLSDMQAKLQGEIVKAGQSSATLSVALKTKLAALEDAVRQTAKATGAGEKALKSKLEALEKAFLQAVEATGQGDDALRARLAELQAGLRALASTPPQVVRVEPVAAPVDIVPEPVKTTATVGVIRGTNRKDYEVPYFLPAQ